MKTKDNRYKHIIKSLKILSCVLLDRYVLQFKKETEAELRERKEQARRILTPLPQTALEVSSEQFFPDDLKFPVRPPWDHNMTKEQLDARENRYFTVRSP